MTSSLQPLNPQLPAGNSASLSAITEVHLNLAGRGDVPNAFTHSEYSSSLDVGRAGGHTPFTLPIIKNAESTRLPAFSKWETSLVYLQVRRS